MLWQFCSLHAWFFRITNRRIKINKRKDTENPKQPKLTTAKRFLNYYVLISYWDARVVWKQNRTLRKRRELVFQWNSHWLKQLNNIAKAGCSLGVSVCFFTNRIQLNQLHREFQCKHFNCYQLTTFKSFSMLWDGTGDSDSDSNVKSITDVDFTCSNMTFRK